jgi:hypothetical protein
LKNSGNIGLYLNKIENLKTPAKAGVFCAEWDRNSKDI